MTTASRILERVARARLEFDRAFAEPPRVADVATTDLLAIRAGNRSCAIRVSEIAGLHLDKKVTPVPGTDRSLRGIAAFRGTILPVHDLAVLLGESAMPAPPRWLLVATAAPIALALHGFEGQRRVVCGDIVGAPPGQGDRHAAALVRGPIWNGPLLALSSVLQSIGGAATPGGPQQET
jgi:purine-binding chemotaxis protein CheW